MLPLAGKCFLKIFHIFHQNIYGQQSSFTAKVLHYAVRRKWKAIPMESCRYYVTCTGIISHHCCNLLLFVAL